MELVIAAALGLTVGAGAIFLLQLVQRNAERKSEFRIRQTIARCFAKSGLDASVSCIKRQSGYFVCIESEPSKKLRFSHIKEQALVAHVERTTGQNIERIFWRFRMKGKEEQMNASGNSDAAFTARENNFDERVPMRAHDADYKVDEIAWDNFAEYVHANEKPAITETQFNRIAAGNAA